MKHIATICGLVACLAIGTLNPKEANAYCVALPGQGGVTHFPVWSQKGRKLVLLKNSDERVVAYITNKGGSSLQDCKPSVMYDKAKLRCRTERSDRSLSEFEMESNYRVICVAKSSKNSKSRMSIYAQGRKDVEVWSYQSRATLLAISQQLTGKMKALEALASDAMDGANNAYEMATEAKGIAIRAEKRKSAKVSIEIDGFVTPVNQGMPLNDYAAGGVGAKFTYWFLEKGKNNQFKLGASVGLRWHRMMLTIDGAPQDADVPGDQYDLTFNLSFRWKPSKWVSLDLFGGFAWIFFHTQDQVADQADNGDIAGPNGDVSQNFGLNFGGGINLHIGQFYVGPSIMGAMIFNGLYHPNFEFQGDARRGTVMHFYAGLKAGVRF